MRCNYMKITRRALRGLSVLIAAAILICLIPGSIVSAGTGLGVSISGNKEIGSTITVSVTVPDGGPYSGFNGAFNYDPAYLELKSIVSGDYQKVNFQAPDSNFVEYAANIPSGAVIVRATFTCKAAGSTTVGCALEALGDMNGAETSPSGSKDVTITTPIPKSSNANLASLAISPGTLSPAFSAGTQSYSATVGGTATKITVSAAPADAKSTVSLNGVQNKLVDGLNTVKITVTAENGSTKVYTIAVTKTAGPTPTPSPTPVPLPLMKYSGADYTILLAGTADAIPEGFAAGTAKYQNVDIPVLQKTLGDAVDASVMTIVLLAGDTKTAYFVYDAVTQTVYPYQIISSAVLSFQILDKSVTTSVPEGYEAFDFTYLDNPVTAFRLISDPSNPQILMNLLDTNGIAAFYYFDTLNGMLMPYRGAVTITAATPSPTPTAAPSVTEIPVTSAVAGLTSASASTGLTFRSLLDYKNPVVLLVYLLVLFCLVILTVCIVLIVKRGKPYDPEEIEDEPDDSQEPIDFLPVSPFVAPAPSVFFNDFGNQPPDTKLHFGDTPPVEEAKLNVPGIPDRANDSVRPVQSGTPPVQSAIPARPVLMMPAPSALPKRPVSNVQSVLPAPPAAVSTPDEHVPVRLRQELEAEKTLKNESLQAGQNQKPKPVASDPDFDPDDE